MTDDKDDKLKLTRRGLLLGAAATGSLGMLAGQAPAAFAGGHVPPPEDDVDLSLQHDFYKQGGQAGINTPVQRYAMFMAFDLTTDKRTDLQTLLALWSSGIAQMMRGEPIGQVAPRRPHAIGRDTGEALNLGPAGLTVTVGLGPNVFTDTYGLAGQKPTLLRELKHLPGDPAHPEVHGGDLSLQACANDPQVAYHAIRDLARIAKSIGAASTRWAILGFGRASAGKNQITPRNLFGFRDGTRNVSTEEEFDRHVWIKDGPARQHHGSYQIIRKIRMDIENWDNDPVSDQMRIFGRYKVSGAPLTGHKEFDTPNFKKRDADGKPVIDPLAHIRLAAHENNDGIRILRRSFNYTDGINQFGLLDAGLMFITYQNDPAHFETIQAKLGASDALNEYISHIGSAIFYTPPAPQAGSYIGAELFA